MAGRVLVVDDVLPNVKLLAAKLAREYYDVTTATSGEEALRCAKSAAPDIILLDVMMPDLNGFEVCERLKADPDTAHVPVVMITALSDGEDRLRGLSAGADDFLTKPVDDVALFARVRSLVRLKKMIDEWRLREATSSRFGMPQVKVESAETGGRGGRVLILEDSALEGGKMSEALAQDGHQVRVERETGGAFEAARDGELDLAVVSVTLEDEDGLRFCAQLSANPPTRNLPILLVADEVDMARIVKGLDLGASDYVMRPVDRNELQARVRTQIRRKRYQQRLRDNYERSLAMALTDSLTGLFNRRYFMSHLESMVARIEVETPPALLLFDVDAFKTINDTYGHLVGDDVVRDLARRVADAVRGVDLTARLGGDEFALLLPATSLAQAQAAAERLRAIVAGLPFRAPQEPEGVRVTISIGVAAAVPGDTSHSLFHRADMALYEAKRAGRNCVRAAPADTGTRVDA